MKTSPWFGREVSTTIGTSDQKRTTCTQPCAHRHCLRQIIVQNLGSLEITGRQGTGRCVCDEVRTDLPAGFEYLSSEYSFIRESDRLKDTCHQV